MTLPDNIKAEIGKAAQQHADKFWIRKQAPHQWAEVFYAYLEGTTRFYELGIGADSKIAISNPDFKENQIAGDMPAKPEGER